MKKLIVFVVACCFIFTGCGSDSGSKAKSTLSTLSKNTELTSQLSKKKYTPEFVLLGTHYELPCKLQDFYDQGWELIDQIEDNPFVKDTFMLEAESYINITLIKDYKAFRAQVDNKSKEATLLTGESMISSVDFYNNGNVTADDFVFAGKGTIKSSTEDLAALYADYKHFNDDNLGVTFTADNGFVIYVRKNIDDKSIASSVQVNMRGERSSQLKGISISENQVIDKAKNASVDLKFNSETNTKYSPKKYKKILEDISSEDGVRNIVFNGKVIDKAAAKSSAAFILDAGEEIYIVEDELGNKYAFYSKVGNNFVVSNLNIGDTVKLYCDYLELLKVDEDVNYPLLHAKIVYINDVLVVDAASEL